MTSRWRTAAAAAALMIGLAVPSLNAPATAATLTPVTIDCGGDIGGSQVSGQVGDTLMVTVTGPCTFAISTPGVVSWTDGVGTDPLTSGTGTLTFTLTADGTTTWSVTNGMGYDVQFIVSDLGTFSCSVAADEAETVSGSVGDTVSFHANGSCLLQSSTEGVVTWTSGGPNDPASATNAVVILTLSASGSTRFTARWPSYPGDGGELTIDVTVADGSAPGDASAPSVPEWVQAVGRLDADAPCPDGWLPSWQGWAMPVTGGWVCTRTLPAYGT